MISIGIEGPASSGKSTAIREAAARLAEASQVSVGCVPCFVEWARQTSLALPHVRPSTWAEQSSAVSHYVAMEPNRRRRVESASVQLLDRTCLTLAAHTSALIALGLRAPSNGLRQVEQLVAPFRPAVVIYLDTPQRTLELRSATRPDFPALLVEPSFNSLFRQYFLTGGRSDFVIDGNAAIEQVGEQVAGVIRRLLTNKPECGIMSNNEA